MIKMTELDAICSRLEHSSQPNGGGEWPGLPPAETGPQKPPEFAAFNGIAAPTLTVPGRAQRHARAKIERALAYMLQNLDKPVQVSHLATMAKVSVSNFYYWFKLTTGYTPNDFLIRARMGRACALLQGTDLSVKEVSAALGYDDPFYFSRVFKSVSAVAPIHYRRLHPRLQGEIKNRLEPRAPVRNGGSPGRTGLAVCPLEAAENQPESAGPMPQNDPPSNPKAAGHQPLSLFPFAPHRNLQKRTLTKH